MSGCLYVEFADGTTSVLSTGNGWKAVLNGAAAWYSPEFDDRNWPHAIVYDTQADTAGPTDLSIGNGEAFRKGREFAAWLGLVPREYSTGGKQKLLGKRGNGYLRKLFVQGARAVLQFRDKHCSGLRRWLAELSSRSHYNVVGVALANKLARMAWAALASGDTYRAPVSSDMTGLQMASSDSLGNRYSHIRKPATTNL